VIDPSFQRVSPVTKLIHDESCTPQVIFEANERLKTPNPLATVAIEHSARNEIMSVTKYYGRNFYGITNNSFDRITSAVDLRPNFFNNHTLAAVNTLHTFRMFILSRRPDGAAIHLRSEVIRRDAFWTTSVCS
jgi:hypothetical protein